MIRLPIAVASRPSSRPSQATTVVATMPPIGAWRRSTAQERRAGQHAVARDGVDPARRPALRGHAAGEKSEQDDAANGLLDQSPKDATTAVETGSMSLPATTSAGFGCASVVAKALRITSAPTLSSAIQIARGTCLAAPLVSSAAATVASKPMNAQPRDRERGQQRGEGRAAAERLGAERVEQHGEALLAEDEQQREPDADRGDGLGGDAQPQRALERVDAEGVDERADGTRTAPVITIACAVGVMPSSISAHGAPRYAIVVLATAYAHSATQPVNQP